MPGDLNVSLGQPGGSDQTAPVIWDKAARDRDASVAQDEWVPARKPCEHAETVVWKPMTVQVADEPAAPGMRLHPADEFYHRVVGEVVGELRADDVVEAGSLGLEGKHVGGVKGDAR